MISSGKKFDIIKKGDTMYVECLLELKTKQIAESYTYKVPEYLKDQVAVGKRVNVPFGHQILEGFILKITNDPPKDIKILEINALVDEEVVLTEELMAIGSFIKDSTLCSLASAYQTMLPKALKASSKTEVHKKYAVFLKLTDTYEAVSQKCSSPIQKEIVTLISNNILLNKKEANEISASAVKTLLKKNLIVETKEEIYRLQENTILRDTKRALTEEQEKAVQEVIKNLNTHQKYLLHGVTGSGKTEVYMQIIEKVLKLNKTAIVLVPEISLTPQFLHNFRLRFGNSIAVLHSGLSDGEKYDEWRKIARGEVQIVIGARSAIFAPLKNLGIIIVDEEHSESYKQENNPKYNAIDVAEFRASYNQIPILLGSATPTLEKMARAGKNLYKLLKLEQRVNHSPLPNCILVDMKEEIKKGNYFLSERLKVEIESAISRGEQILLLLNRRGYSTTITCSKCGFTYKCPNCDITLTYHKTKDNLRCHYCGYTIFKKDTCPKCQEALNFYGYGTEKLEAEIKKEYPDLRVLRMDADTTRGKNSHARIIEKFRNHEYDILLGTQMISKGLDFPMVSVVGVINADATFNIPDFRSGERTFDLLYQASGRAGRSGTVGNVVIQTFAPSNFILSCVADQDYQKFYQYEMNIRKKLKYPPYYYLVSLKIISKDYEVCSKEAFKVAKYLKENISKTSIVLGPTTANVFKMNNLYRFQVIVKYRFDEKLVPTLKELDKLFALNKKVNLDIDRNPTQI